MRCEDLNATTLRQVFLVLTETAAKTCEIDSLRWKQVNLKNRTIFFNDQKIIYDRNIAISEEFAHALEKRKEPLRLSLPCTGQNSHCFQNF